MQQGYGANACSGTTTVWASRGTRLLLLTCMCIVLLLMLLSKRTMRRLCIRVTCHSRVTHVPHVPSSRLSRPPWRPIHHRLHVRAISMWLNIFPSSRAAQALTFRIRFERGVRSPGAAARQPDGSALRSCGSRTNSVIFTARPRAICTHRTCLNRLKVQGSGCARRRVRTRGSEEAGA